MFCNVFSSDLEERLSKLKALNNKGLITQQDYEKAKQELIQNFTGAPVPEMVSPPAGDNLIAIIPFYGKVYSDGDRDSIAKFAEKNCQLYIRDNEYSVPGGVMEFYIAKNHILKFLNVIDPDEPYSIDFLRKIAETLKVRYLFFGQIDHFSFTQRIHRFNVECQVYDYSKNKIVFTRRARQSSARKLFMGLPEKGKAFGKISEQFYFFLDDLNNDPQMKENPFRKKKK
jgi:hypothetical protein